MITKCGRCWKEGLSKQRKRWGGGMRVKVTKILYRYLLNCPINIRKLKENGNWLAEKDKFRSSMIKSK